ncbi:cytochrome c-type biogenesis CcmF C-terminal domain-containing protein [Ruminiclostridium josui]|uniref:cytochrome c-type biogenesis CcmF C-terminal domain-containing protein n=1 Tax=Ruminiclostridium josui TaxID=1499 RepID=UPI0030EC2A70
MNFRRYYIPFVWRLFLKAVSDTPISFYEYVFGVFGILVLLILAINPSLYTRKVLLIPGSVCGLAVLALMLFLCDYGFLTKLSLAVCAMLTVNLIIELAFNYKKHIGNKKSVAVLLLHAPLIIMVVGFAGSMGMLLNSDVTIEKGNTAVVGKYEVKYRNLYWKEEPGKTTAVSVIGVSGPKGKLQLKPELSYYQKMKISHSRAVIKSGLGEDLYIIFEGIDDKDNITLKVKIVKFVSLVWIGSILLLIGTILYYFSENKKTRILIKNILEQEV